MKTFYLFVVYLLWTCSAFVQAQTTYYVDPNPNKGKDSNPGTEQYPFRTIQKAADVAKEGATVFLRGGEYIPQYTVVPLSDSTKRPNWGTYTPLLKYTKKGGDPGQPIVFKNYPGETPILRPHPGHRRSNGTRSNHPDSSGSWSLIKIYTDPKTPAVLPAHLVFDGLVFYGRAREIDLQTEGSLLENQRGSQKTPCPVGADGVPVGCESPRYNGQGFVATGPFAWDPDIKPLFPGSPNAIPHHITVRNCVFKEFPGAGVSFQRADYITVENCEVANNCWYTIFGSSGINLYQCVTTPSLSTQEDPYRVKIINNLCYGNGLKVKNQNLPVRYDGNGIIIDDFIHAQDYVSTDSTKKKNNPNRGNHGYKFYEGRTLVANNILFANGGSGIKVYSTQNTDVFHNTLFNNGIGHYRYNTDTLSLQYSLFVQAIVNEQEAFWEKDFEKICAGALPKNTLWPGYNRVYNNLTYNTMGYRADGNNSQVSAACLALYVATAPADANPSAQNYKGNPEFMYLPPAFSKDYLIDKMNTSPLDVTETYSLKINGQNKTIQSYVLITCQRDFFKLKPDSKAIHYGIPIWKTQNGIVPPAYTYDMNGYTRDALPDAGVYETPTPCTPYIEAGSGYMSVPAHTVSTIEPEKRTVFRTQRYILLRNTFEAKPGSVFVMEVEKCNITPNALRVRTTEPDILQSSNPTSANPLLIAYPNPVSLGQELYFTIPVREYRLFNGAGMEVRRGTVKGSLSMSGLSKGLYILHTDAGVQKIVVE